MQVIAGQELKAEPLVSGSNILPSETELLLSGEKILLSVEEIFLDGTEQLAGGGTEFVLTSSNYTCYQQLMHGTLYDSLNDTLWGKVKMLKGISIGDYRSIGEQQAIVPLGKINLFVGPNNSGKSNILRFVNENMSALITQIKNGNQQVLTPNNHHVGRGKPTQAGLCVHVSVQDLHKIWKNSNHVAGIVATLHAKIAPHGYVWIDGRWPSKELIDQASLWIGQNSWNSLWSSATDHYGGGLKEAWIPGLLRFIRDLIPDAPPVFAIPIDRRAGQDAKGETKTASTVILSGNGVIRALAAMQNPGHGSYDEDRKKFTAIESFVRTVTDDPTASISVPHKQDEILVQLKGQRFLPLASLGSGIEQVVLHAVAATSASNAIITFEEPELHLHPVLQRQLMMYLAKTSNQYFISTHSAHLIDSAHTNTFHVRLIDGQTIIERADTDARRHEICFELGYRASDIVQANCVIWVEGPSDRIYLRHWIKLIDEHLCEHVHYSIMFYGGKLLSHLSASESDVSDESLDDLIKLRLLNRQVAVVIDSDIKKAGEEIRETKKRIEKEIGENGGFVWVSAGREIENYVPNNILSVAVEAVAAGRGASTKSGQYEKVLPTIKDGSETIVDKVAVAKKVVDGNCGLDELDLKEKIKSLSIFIRKANGLSQL